MSSSAASRARSVWDAVLAQGLVLGIEAYRAVLSPLIGGFCRFEPTCSRFAEEAILRHGPYRGTALAMGRLLKCRPFGPRGLDPVP